MTTCTSCDERKKSPTPSTRRRREACAGGPGRGWASGLAWPAGGSREKSSEDRCHSSIAILAPPEISPRDPTGQVSLRAAPKPQPAAPHSKVLYRDDKIEEVQLPNQPGVKLRRTIIDEVIVDG